MTDSQKSKGDPMPSDPSPLDDLERLKAEWQKSVHELRCQPNSGINQLNLAAAEKDFGNALFRHSLYLLTAAREGETLREDAERYRRLRNGESRLWVTSGIEEHGTEGCDDHEVFANAHYGDALDAELDAARKGQGE